jgi:hypothetical protein
LRRLKQEEAAWKLAIVAWIVNGEGLDRRASILDIPPIAEEAQIPTSTARYICV